MDRILRAGFGLEIHQDIMLLEMKGEISFHREGLGDLWIRCPAYSKVRSVVGYVTAHPGSNATEIRKALNMSQRVFEKESEGLKKVRQGRETLYYPVEDGPEFPDMTEMRQEYCREMLKTEGFDANGFPNPKVAAWCIKRLSDKGLLEEKKGLWYPVPQDGEPEDRSEPSEDARELFNKFQGYAGFDFTLEDIEANLRDGNEGRFGEWRMGLASEEDLRKLRMIFVKKGIPVDKDFTLQEISESWGEGKTTCLKVLRRLTDAGFLSRDGKTWRKT